MTATEIQTKKTKAKLLDAAQSLMLQKGYVATSVDEICSTAGVTKGSFFHYFKNKEALGKEVLAYFMAQMGDMIKEELDKAATDPLDRVYAILDILSKASQDEASEGCLLGNFAQEISKTHPEIRNVCEEGFKKSAELFRYELIQARNTHTPVMDFDANTLADYFISVTQGSHILVKAKEDKKIFASNIEHLRSYIRCLFGK